MESKDWITLAIATVGWSWALYQQIASLRAKRPHYVVAVKESSVQPGQVNISVAVRNRAPLDLYLHSVEILKPFAPFLQVSTGSFYERPTEGVGKVPVDIHLDAWSSGVFPAAEFSLALLAIPNDVDDVCIRFVASRRSDGKKSMSFKDCFAIERKAIRR